MAAARVNEIGKLCVSKTTRILNSESFRKDAKIGLNLCYDGKRIKWLNDFDSLKIFVENVVERSGKWTSRRTSRKFISSGSDLVMTWYYGKQKTLFHGKAGLELKEALIQICAEKSFFSDNADPCLENDRKD